MSLSISTFILGPVENNTYLIADTKAKIAAIIDPSIASRELSQVIKDNNWDLKYILITHAHFDHIGGVKWFKTESKHKLNIALHSADLDLWREGGSSKDFGFDLNVGSEPNLFLDDNQIILMGDISIKVLHTPGHSPGHVTFSIANDLVAFCGDLIFYHNIGCTDLQTSNEDDLRRSITEKIFKLSPNTTLYPGHGRATTVLEEMENNPLI
jgi:hydroxyacylglutathione hydrolase